MLLVPVLAALSGVLPLLDSSSVDSTPAAEDVKAGWGALLLFVLLILAVVFLAFSLSKQLRKARAARDAGVYGDPPKVADEDAPGAERG
jgi:ABC-type uncharacterized transport system permease subunit